MANLTSYAEDNIDLHNLNQQGRFIEAIKQGKQLTQNINKLDNPAQTLVQMAIAYQQLGYYPEAGQRLTQAKQQADKTSTTSDDLYVMTAQGDYFLATDQINQAESVLKKALEQVTDQTHPLIQARINNNLGNVYTAQWAFQKAEATYQKALDQAKSTNNQLLQSHILLNLALTAKQTDADQLQYLNQAAQQIKNIAGQHDKAFALVSLAQQLLALKYHDRVQPNQILANANQYLLEAIQIASKINDARLLSYAYGYQGRLYEYEQRNSEAQALTYKALFYAQKASTSESLYLWQWQMGRLLVAEKNLDGAIERYNQAVESLKTVKTDLYQGLRKAPDSFREMIGPVYYQLADLLLQKSRHVGPEQKKCLLKKSGQVAPDQNNCFLKKARNTIELLKSSEIQELFQDDCVSVMRSKETALDKIAKDTAIIYPILLKNKLEIILTLPSGFENYNKQISAQRIEKEARKLRVQLEYNKESEAYLQHSQRLYRWLIEPIWNELENQSIKHLVIVPDGALRTIPLASLHDGKQFLIEKIAVATTPGLALTDPNKIDRNNITLLANGLSEAVQGFSKLENVPKELELIQTVFDSKVLLNQDYTHNNVSKLMKSQAYPIVHFATHGKFDRDPKKTFLLTYNGKLDLKQLEELIGMGRFRDDPIELLTLSACQTAVGDDRAALGLAGIAMKSGARSALASLWFVDDEATSILISEFYQQLKDPNLTKAQALQKAQKALIKNPQLSHPALWAPFILIGNWL